MTCLAKRSVRLDDYRFTKFVFNPKQKYPTKFLRPDDDVKLAKGCKKQISCRACVRFGKCG